MIYLISIVIIQILFFIFLLLPSINDKTVFNGDQIWSMSIILIIVAIPIFGFFICCEEYGREEEKIHIFYNKCNYKKGFLILAYCLPILTLLIPFFL